MPPPGERDLILDWAASRSGRSAPKAAVAASSPMVAGSGARPAGRTERLSLPTRSQRLLMPTRAWVRQVAGYPFLGPPFPQRASHQDAPASPGEW